MSSVSSIIDSNGIGDAGAQAIASAISEGGFKVCILKMSGPFIARGISFMEQEGPGFKALTSACDAVELS